MDTAKVDIRRLQLLNDRINQTIEALNQVRFSVHGVTSGQGLSHAGQGFGQAQNPYAAMGQGFGVPGIPGIGLPSPALGLGHTGFPQGQFPQGQFPSAVGSYGQGSLPQTIYGNPMLAQNPALFGLSLPLTQSGIPFGQPGVPGLSHSGGFGVESGRGIWGDPYLASQIAQTFPNAQSPFPPVMTVY